MMKLSKYSIGIGDRFAHQAKAQLQACLHAREAGVELTPVWNKSNREHTIIGSDPSSTRVAADKAVTASSWTLPYFCDADHINLSTVDRFLPFCDFYTIDVAEFIGLAPDPESLEEFVEKHLDMIGTVPLEGVDQLVTVSKELLRCTASRFLHAVEQAGKIFRHIEHAKGKGTFVAEVSMDETDTAQTPAELLVILAAIADQNIPIQTIAPKFSGRFNKGVDYVGQPAQFEEEMALDIAAIRYAVAAYGLPASLKLSIHSGSDKFSIYRAIYANMTRFSTGVHLKTAGTTWLEEVIGLAESGGQGLALAKEIYAEAFDHAPELCAPYSSVIDIDHAKLPRPVEVARWSSLQFTSALRHNPHSPAYNPGLRQLLHVGFKVAAKLGHRYLDLIEANEAVIARNVTENLFARHICPVFLGQPILYNRSPDRLSSSGL